MGTRIQGYQHELAVFPGAVGSLEDVVKDRQKGKRVTDEAKSP